MKLELKHLAPYLPYKSTFYVDMENFTNGNSKPELRKFTLDADNLKLCMGYGKLALRPISDLTKEIEHNGEKFVPIEYFSDNYTDNRVRFEKPDCIILEDDYSMSQDVLGAPLAIIEKLFECQLDIFGLIEKGLAVDINTLNK